MGNGSLNPGTDRQSHCHRLPSLLFLLTHLVTSVHVLFESENTGGVFNVCGDGSTGGHPNLPQRALRRGRGTSRPISVAAPGQSRLGSETRGGVCGQLSPGVEGGAPGLRPGGDSARPPGRSVACAHLQLEPGLQPGDLRCSARVLVPGLVSLRLSRSSEWGVPGAADSPFPGSRPQFVTACPLQPVPGSGSSPHQGPG